jgi:hypothetical protein
MKQRIKGVEVEVLSVSGCGCTACHALRRIEEVKLSKPQQGMKCASCGHGWWSFDPCCRNPVPSGEFVEKFWEKEALA